MSKLYIAIFAFCLDASVVMASDSKNATALSAELLESALSGSVNRTLSVLEDGANIRAQNQSGKTALHLAIQYQHSEVMRALIRAGASGTIRDSRSHTPLHYAAIHCQSEAITLLAARKERMDFNARNYVGKTALMLAAENGCTKVFLTLLDVGKGKIDLDAVDENLRDVDSYVSDNFLQGFLDRARRARTIRSLQPN